MNQTGDSRLYAFNERGFYMYKLKEKCLNSLKLQSKLAVVVNVDAKFTRVGVGLGLVLGTCLSRQTHVCL